VVVLDDLAAVDYLAVPLGLDGIENELGVLRLVGVDLLAVEQLQGVQHGGGLLGAVLPGDGSQGVLRCLGAVVAGDQDREERVVRGLVLEVRCQADTGDGVHQVAEVDSLVRRQARQVADGFALGPFGHGLGTALIGDLEGIAHVLLQPLDQFFQKTVGFRFIGDLGVAR